MFYLMAYNAHLILNYNNITKMNLNLILIKMKTKCSISQINIFSKKIQMQRCFLMKCGPGFVAAQGYQKVILLTSTEKNKLHREIKILFCQLILYIYHMYSYLSTCLSI